MENTNRRLRKFLRNYAIGIIIKMPCCYVMKLIVFNIYEKKFKKQVNNLFLINTFKTLTILIPFSIRSVIHIHRK